MNWIFMHKHCFNVSEKSAIYALLACKIYGPKFWLSKLCLRICSLLSSVSHLHLRQDIVDETVLDEVEVDQLVLQLDDPADGGVKQLAEE